MPKSLKVTFSVDFETKALLQETADLPKSVKVTFSAEEIGEAVGLDMSKVAEELRSLCGETADLPKSQKVTRNDENAHN